MTAPRLSRIPDDEIAAVRAQAGLVDTISQRGVKLIRRGREYVGLCPFHKEKTPSFTVNEDKGFYHCFGCAAHGDVITFVMGFAGCSFREAVEDLYCGHGFTDPDVTRRAAERQHHAKAERHAQDKREVRSRLEYARHLWRKAVPASATLVETYLRARGITIPIPPSLRYLAAAKHKPTGLILPAMIGGVQGVNGTIVGVHRTFLCRDGTAKASVRELRMSLGPVAGGAVRFGPAAHGLAVAEGIETALSIAQAYPDLSVWSGISTSLMRRLLLPPQVREVVLCVDGDEAGDKAGRHLAERFASEGRAVRIAPAPDGQDYNDLTRILA
jgi:DNA primase